jgi:uncharacterized membrane protein
VDLTTWWFWYPESTDWMLIACILTAATSVPLALRLIPPNPVYGFRTRFTRSDPRVWYDANAFVGRLMVFASIVSAGTLLWGPAPAAGWISVAIVMVPVMLVTLAGFVYLRHLRESIERR